MAKGLHDVNAEQASPEPERKWSKRGIALAAGGAAAALIAAGTTYGLVSSTQSSKQATSTKGAQDVNVQLHSAASQDASRVPTGHKGAGVKQPLSVVSVNPADGSNGAPANAPIVVTYNGPLDKNQPKPTLTPPLAGDWQQSGSTMTFHPQAGYVPGTAVAVNIPSGVNSSDKSFTASAQPTVAHYTVAPMSEERLQQILAELGYLPLNFFAAQPPAAVPAPAPAPVPPGAPPAPAPPPPGPPPAITTEPTTAGAVSSAPIPGSFNWSFPNTPASLMGQWHEGQRSTITQGALMAFQNDRNLKADGSPGPQVWAQLLQAVANRWMASHPYSYFMVHEGGSESLQVWQAGKIVASSAVNTGMPGAATPKGTFPVFEHVPVTSMKGTLPGGITYNDPQVWWDAFFNGGDAVHAFPRASYGSPQSNGCVEVPPGSAPTFYKYDPIGTLVNVS